MCKGKYDDGLVISLSSSTFVCPSKGARESCFGEVKVCVSWVQ